jgi:hypothetical protein
MGSASAQFKAFMDSTSAVWALQGWRDKLAAGFTHSAAPSGDKLGTLMQLAVFAAQHGMIWVGLGLPPTYAGLDPGVDDTNRLGSHLGAMAHSRPGGGGRVPESDLATAELLGKRVAQAAQRWRLQVPIPRSSRSLPDADAPARHFATRGWTFPLSTRAPPAEDIQRINLKEIVARPDRFEHHLIVAASVDDVRFEVTTASEPLYFAHINVSDEYAVAMHSVYISNQAFSVSRCWQPTDQLQGTSLEWGVVGVLMDDGAVWIGFESTTISATSRQFRH